MKSILSFSYLRYYVALLLFLFTFVTVSAEESLTPPQLVIQHTAKQLQKNLQLPEYKQNFKKATQFVDSVIEPQIDFEQVAKLVLGKFWKTATPEQKVRFQKEFRFLLVRTYTTAFTEYADWQINYLPMKIESDDKVVVKTHIIQSGAPPVAVDYRMRSNQGTWKVYDVLIEGVSLLANYRTSFTSEVSRTGSLEQLITELAQRNATALNGT